MRFKDGEPPSALPSIRCRPWTSGGGEIMAALRGVGGGALPNAVGRRAGHSGRAHRLHHHQLDGLHGDSAHACTRHDVVGAGCGGAHEALKDLARRPVRRALEGARRREPLLPRAAKDFGTALAGGKANAPDGRMICKQLTDVMEARLANVLIERSAALGLGNDVPDRKACLS